MKKLNEHNVRKITQRHNEYTRELDQLFQPPVLLYVAGKPLDSLNPRVAIVGSRRCTAYGRAIAEELAEELAGLGVVIVSGLALGIDTAAHRGALRSGQTIGVLGCGLDIVYPVENKYLYDQIPKNGAIISEYMPGTLPLRHHFPARNRIISGISLGVVIVEAAVKSGALITADHALEQGKEVMVVPGHAKSPNSKGCHRLIKSGAALVDSAKDVLEVLQLEIVEKPAPMAATNPDEKSLLGSIDYETDHIDQIAARAGKSVSEISSLLLQLEIKGYIRREVGGRIIRVK